MREAISRHLFSRLSLTENGFWITAAHAAMMVDVGKAQIFVRQRLELTESLLGSLVAAGDCIEDLAQVLSIHDRFSIAQSGYTLNFERKSPSSAMFQRSCRGAVGRRVVGKKLTTWQEKRVGYSP